MPPISWAPAHPRLCRPVRTTAAARLAQRRLKIRDGHAFEPDPELGREGRPDEVDACLAKLLVSPHTGWMALASRLPEVREAHVGRHRELTIGLAVSRGELGEEFVVGDAGGGGQAGLLQDAGTDLASGGPRRRQPRKLSVTSR